MKCGRPLLAPRLLPSHITIPPSHARAQLPSPADVVKLSLALCLWQSLIYSIIYQLCIYYPSVYLLGIPHLDTVHEYRVLYFRNLCHRNLILDKRLIWGDAYDLHSADWIPTKPAILKTSFFCLNQHFSATQCSNVHRVGGECSIEQTCNQCLTMFNDVDFQESVLRWDGNRNNLSKHS